MPGSVTRWGEASTQPSNWARQNLRYAAYSLEEGEGRRIWDDCLALSVVVGQESGVETLLDEPRFGKPALVRPRLGQGAFRVAVTDAYGRSCSATGEHSLPALEAAHIKSFALDGPHAVTNGLLLRSDFHRLFDRGYVTVTHDYRLEVSDRLKDHFHNGHSVLSVAWKRHSASKGALPTALIRLFFNGTTTMCSWDSEA